MMHTAVWLSTLHLFFSAPVSHAEEDNELVVEANTPEADAESESSGDNAPIELTPEQLTELKESIERENARLKEDYEAKLTVAQNSVRLLNSRFGDWFYLIDEITFNKIHLANTDLLRSKTTELDNGLQGLPDLPGLPEVQGLPNLPDASPDQPLDSTNE